MKDKKLQLRDLRPRNTVKKVRTDLLTRHPLASFDLFNCEKVFSGFFLKMKKKPATRRDRRFFLFNKKIKKRSSLTCVCEAR